MPGLRRTLVRPPGSTPWWAPPDRLDRRGADVLGLLCTISLVAGYLGTVFTQTATFAADEFGARPGPGRPALGGPGLDRHHVRAVEPGRPHRAPAASCHRGRVRRLLFTATSALSPSLAALAATQTLARGFAGALILLIVIVSAEEMPRGSRAYAYSVLTMCQALGAGMCLWALPLADIGGDGSASWRPSTSSRCCTCRSCSSCAGTSPRAAASPASTSRPRGRATAAVLAPGGRLFLLAIYADARQPALATTS